MPSASIPVRTGSCWAATVSAATSCPGCSTASAPVGSLLSSVVAIGLLFGGLVGSDRGCHGWLGRLGPDADHRRASCRCPPQCPGDCGGRRPRAKLPAHADRGVDRVVAVLRPVGAWRGGPAGGPAARRGRETRRGEPFSAGRPPSAARCRAQCPSGREPRHRHADPDVGGAVVPRPRPIRARRRTRCRFRPQPELLPAAVVDSR